jgi:hypothetical protein
MTKTTLLKAMKAMCLECSGSHREVALCPQIKCALSLYRSTGPRTDEHGKIRPEFRKALVRQSIKAHCYDCVGWDGPGCETPAKLCTSPNCPLFPFRLGHTRTDEEKESRKGRIPGITPPGFRRKPKGNSRVATTQ